VNADSLWLIDSGSGGYINIPDASPISSFGAEAYNTTNGVDTKYFFSWFTDVPTYNGDFVFIGIP